jgi:acetyltransferase-like isoleucine patch superfamily enzyme
VQAPAIRIVQRYLTPRWIVSGYYLLRDRSLVSRHARVQLSRRISFGRGTVVKPFAVIQTQGGRIAFGSGCAVSSFDHISTGTKDLIVGSHVRIAPSVTILGGSRNYERRHVRVVDQGSFHEGLIIGDDVLIGANVVILPGSHIGTGAVIGAGSVVNREVAPYAIVAGVPAKVIGERR